MRPSSLLVTTALASALAASLVAQTVPEVKLPPSPMGQAEVQLGGRWEKTADGERYRDGKWLVVDYGRPLLRGRTGIFGSGADYGKRVSPDATIWRMGANDSTTLTTQAPLQIGGGTLQPGVYNLFADLEATGWTLVANTQPRQPKYDPNEKVLLYGVLQLRRQVRRAARADDRADHRRVGRAADHRLRERDRHERHAHRVVGQDDRVGGHQTGDDRHQVEIRRRQRLRPPLAVFGTSVAERRHPDVAGGFEQVRQEHAARNRRTHARGAPSPGGVVKVRHGNGSPRRWGVRSWG